MTRLKILLQSNKIYYCLLIATILYVGIKVKIGYTSKINVNEDFTGIVTTIVKKENSFKLTIKGKEKLIVYISNIENNELYITRGGDWYNNEESCRNTYKSLVPKGSKGNNIGFRLACSEM